MERVYDEVTKRALDMAFADADQQKRRCGRPVVEQEVRAANSIVSVMHNTSLIAQNSSSIKL
jgi:hypothetical protein